MRIKASKVFTPKGSPHMGGHSRWRRSVVKGCFNLVQREKDNIYLVHVLFYKKRHIKPSGGGRLIQKSTGKQEPTRNRAIHPIKLSKRERKPLHLSSVQQQNLKRANKTHFMSRQELSVSYTGKMEINKASAPQAPFASEACFSHHIPPINLFNTLFATAWI